MTLDCRTLSAVEAALGDSWQFGIPFSFTPGDDLAKCLDVIEKFIHGTIAKVKIDQSPLQKEIDAFRLSSEMSPADKQALIKQMFRHIEGSHPGITGFPSLQGPEAGAKP